MNNKKTNEYCRKCGEKLNSEEKYCQNCGNPTNDNLENEKKKKRKKLIFALICIFIIFWAIGQSSSDDNKEKASASSTGNATETQDTNKNTKEEKTVDKSLEIFNDQGVVVKIIDYEYKKVTDRMIIKLYIENNTDTTVAFTLNGSASIDNQMVDGGYFYQQVNASAKANEDFFVYNLREKGIDGANANEIKFNFSIYQTENYMIGNKFMDNQPITYTFKK